MKQIVAFFLVCALSSGSASAQTLRTCGCKTWNEWKASDTASKEPRREKRKKYAAYRDDCLRACKGAKEGDPKKEETGN